MMLFKFLCITTALLMCCPAGNAQQRVYYKDYKIVKPSGAAAGGYFLNDNQEKDPLVTYTSYDVIDSIATDSILVKTYNSHDTLTFEGWYSAYSPGDYKNRVRIGLHKFYYEHSTQLYYSETWKADSLEGELRSYYPDGALKRTEQWKGGKFIDGQCFNEDGSPRPFTRFQLPPVYPGGESELLRYISENIHYPKMARKHGIQGIAAISFVINKDGSVSDVRILKDPGEGCGEEAARLIRNMQKWVPGSMDDHPVKVRFTLPVRFRLD